MRRFDVFFWGTIEAIVVMDVYVYIKAGDIKWGYNTYIYIYHVNGDTMEIFCEDTMWYRIFG